MSLISKIDTKKEAFKLIHDPVKLLTLLYLKYGDIEEEYFLSFANKLVYNTSSHYNSLFKEFQFNLSKDEYLKRFYKKRETNERIPMLSDYYKNYHMFFCKPIFREFKLYELLHSNEELKAEIFYNKNYKDEETINILDNKDEKDNDTSLSSLDNITNNKIIFDKTDKNIIDNDLDEKMLTISLNTDSARNKINSNENVFGLVSKRSLNGSFEKIVKNLVEYQFNKNKKNKEIKIKNSRKNFLFKINNGCYTSNHLSKKKKKIIAQNSYKHIYNHIIVIKNSLNTLSRKTFSYKNRHFKSRIKNPKSKSHSIKNILYSTNVEKNNFFKIANSKINDLSKKKINIKTNDQERNKANNLKSSKFINNQNNNNATLNKNPNYNFNNNLFNMSKNTRATNYSNFSKLSEILNFNKAKTNSNSTSQKMFNTIQHKKHSFNKNMNQFLTINNEQMNYKTFYNNNRKQKNKTFDFNMTNNYNNNKEINNNRTININKNHRNKIIYGGSKFNLVKGNIHLMNHLTRNIPKNSSNNTNHKKNTIHKISMNNSSNYHQYKNNAIKGKLNNYKNSYGKSPKPKFSIIYSKGDVNVSNNNHNLNNNKLFYLSNNNSIINVNKNNIIKNSKIVNKNNVSYTNNNFNINFNNVFFCSQRIASGMTENINYNSENNNIKSNININHRNITKNNNNSNNSNNNTINKFNNNIYIKNLKSIYNISRNKNNIKGSSLTQNQTGNKGRSNNKDSKEKNFYNLNNNYKIPSNKKKYIIIKEKDLNNNSKQNNKNSATIFDEPKRRLINIANKKDKNNQIKYKEDIKQRNYKNINKDLKSNIVSIRGNSFKNIKKNFNLTSKNNSKSKYQKKISNFI